MTVEAQVLLDKFNAATTAVAARIQRLVENQNNLDPEFKSQMETIAAHLQAMGTDAANPTPALPG